MTTPPRIAAHQTPEIIGDIPNALRYMSNAAAEAHDSDILLFPEAFLQGYLATPDHVSRYAVDDPTPILQQLAHVRPALVFGMIEGRGSTYYNSAVVVKGGKLLGVYRKTHLHGSELAVFQPGRDYPVFDLDGFRFGINICYDTQFPEACAPIAAAGGEALLVPAQNMMPRARALEWQHKHNEIRRERVRETGMWLVSADVTGVRGADRIGLGPTCVIDPGGNIVAQVPLGQPGRVAIRIEVRT